MIVELIAALVLFGVAPGPFAHTVPLARISARPAQMRSASGASFAAYVAPAARTPAPGVRRAKARRSGTRPSHTRKPVQKTPVHSAHARTTRRSAHARTARHGQPAEKPTRTIAITVNGEPLPGDSSAQVIGRRVLVPLRETFAALGLELTQSGRTIRSSAPTGEVSFTVGSDRALVAGEPITLDQNVQNIRGTTYVPLGLFDTAFGAQTTYDQRGANVEIVSSLFGRTSGAERQRAGGGTDVQGVVSAIDTNSEPPSITVVRGGTERTISITSGAKFWTEDVTIHTQLPGTLDGVHVGDALHAILARDGRLVSVFDYYRSSSGTIAATSSSALVLGDGRVVTPSSATTITLDAAPAQFGDLRTGDYVTVRSNPETGELRELVASRPSALPTSASRTPGTPPTVSIASVALSAERPLRAGESFDVVMKGTPGGAARFDIGDYLSDLSMRETARGVYTGRFKIPERFNVTDVPVYGELSVAGVSAARVAAPQTLSATTTPPTIDQVAPAPGQTINNPRPSIYATYATPTSIGIDTDSVALLVDGHNVTSSATRKGGFIVYSPATELGDGPVSVVVKVSDAAGNTATKTWNFTVRK